MTRPAGSQPVIEVVIVNYNAGAALTRCVQSVLDQQLPVRITVADNASSDDSIAVLRRSVPAAENLVIQVNDENPGFASAVNAAVLGAAFVNSPGRDADAIPRGMHLHPQSDGVGEASYLLILNPDCEMLPGSLSALCSALEQDHRAALAGPVVVDSKGRPMRGTLRRFPDPWRALLTFSGLWRLGRWVPAFAGVEKPGPLPAETVQAEAVSGACMMLRKAVFREAGGMDSAYGLHCEDLDLMYRLRQRGWHCLYVPSARVFHAQGLSSASRPVWVHWQKHLGMQRFFRKFQARQSSPPLRWLVLAGIWLRFAATLPLALFRR